MGAGVGELVELVLQDGLPGGRVLCPSALVPAPGRYLLAHAPAQEGALPEAVFSAGAIPGGFLAAAPLPRGWGPGTGLSLRGPLGRGFLLPAGARRVALAALGQGVARLRPLLDAALEGGAEVALVSASGGLDLPAAVEVHPPSALPEIAAWADYLAVDLPRAALPRLAGWLGLDSGARAAASAQVLVGADMPCGGLAECGVCAVRTRRGWKPACKDGPVFPLAELL